jgi:hypothetical protein
VVFKLLTFLFSYLFFERSGAEEEIAKQFPTELWRVLKFSIACSSDYSSFQRGHVISNKNYNNSHVFSFDITSPKIVIFQLSHYFSRFFFISQ